MADRPLKVWEFYDLELDETFVGTIVDYTAKRNVTKETLMNWIKKGKLEHHYYCDSDEYSGSKKGKLYWLFRDYQVNGVIGYGEAKRD